MGLQPDRTRGKASPPLIAIPLLYVMWGESHPGVRVFDRGILYALVSCEICESILLYPRIMILRQLLGGCNGGQLITESHVKQLNVVDQSKYPLVNSDN